MMAAYLGVATLVTVVASGGSDGIAAPRMRIGLMRTAFGR